jgi:hypothetical protein
VQGTPARSTCLTLRTLQISRLAMPDEYDHMLKLGSVEPRSYLIDAVLMQQQDGSDDGFGHALIGGPRYRVRMKKRSEAVCHRAGRYTGCGPEASITIVADDRRCADLCRSHFASISWPLLFARVRVANREISARSRRRWHSRVPQRWALDRLLRCPRKADQGDLRYGRRPCRGRS